MRGNRVIDQIVESSPLCCSASCPRHTGIVDANFGGLSAEDSRPYRPPGEAMTARAFTYP